MINKKIIITVILAFLAYFVAISFAFLNLEHINTDVKVEIKPTRASKFKKAEAYLTPFEKNMLLFYYKEHSSSGYDFTLDSLISKRQYAPYSNKDIPFCDVLDMIKNEEVPSRESLENGNALSKQWERMKGVTLSESCESASQENKAVKVIQKKIVTEEVLFEDFSQITDVILSRFNGDDVSSSRFKDNDFSYSIFKKAEIYLTPLENTMLLFYYNDHSFYGYNFTLYSLISKRQHAPYYDKDTPFCDVLDIIKNEEVPSRQSLENGNALSKQWERIKGVTLSESCEHSDQRIQEIQEIQKKVLIEHLSHVK